METGYIHEFVVLADILNYRKASEALFVSQASLTKHIQALEKELGVQLFYRNRHKTELSEDGAAFLPFARKIDEACREGQGALEKSRTREPRSLVIGNFSFSITYGVMDLFTTFRSGHPEYALSIIEGNAEQMREALRRNECDMAVVREIPHAETEFCSFTFAQDTLCAIMPASHPLAGQPYVTAAQLSGEPLLILPESKKVTHELSLQVFRSAGIQPNIAMTSTYSATLVDCAANGMGVCLMTKYPAMRFADERVKMVEIHPRMSVDVRLLYPRDRRHAAVDAILRQARKIKKERSLDKKMADRAGI